MRNACFCTRKEKRRDAPRLPNGLVPLSPVWYKKHRPCSAQQTLRIKRLFSSVLYWLCQTRRNRRNMNNNDSATILTQVLEEMKREQGDRFSLDRINLAELSRRTGISG